jgi:hypothetical protein
VIWTHVPYTYESISVCVGITLQALKRRSRRLRSRPRLLLMSVREELSEESGRELEDEVCIVDHQDASCVEDLALKDL